MMSIGDCDSATVRSLTRVPVTMTVSSVLAWACAGAAVSGAASWARAGPPARMDSRASARVVGTGRGRMVDPLHDVGVIPCSTAVAPLQSLHPHGERLPWVERKRRSVGE